MATFRVKDDGRVIMMVFRGHHSFGTEHLDSLVVPIGRLAAVVDNGHRAALVAHPHHGRIEISRLFDLWIDQRGATSEYLLDGGINEEPGHIEVMNGHVEENPTTDRYVIQRRRLRISRGDAEQMHVPNPPIDDRLLGGLVRGIESLMKTDNEGNVTVGDGSHRTVDLVEVEAHRFLTEDSDTCLSGSADVVHVGRRARADGDGTKVRCG